jgi:hypothetical protein
MAWLPSHISWTETQLRASSDTKQRDDDSNFGNLSPPCLCLSQQRVLHAHGFSPPPLQKFRSPGHYLVGAYFPQIAKHAPRPAAEAPEILSPAVGRRDTLKTRFAYFLGHLILESRATNHKPSQTTQICPTPQRRSDSSPYSAPGTKHEQQRILEITPSVRSRLSRKI